mmetsp:Transcript_27739/g.64106  ORF Transcript_27739/g.64106 Transcript_27739/m.64106 type:complete len:343 (-) Transcript_27739:34-1062(-)
MAMQLDLVGLQGGDGDEEGDRPITPAAKMAERQRDHIAGINQRNAWKLEVNSGQKAHLASMFDAGALASQVVKTWEDKIEEAKERGLKRVDLTLRLTEDEERTAFLEWLAADTYMAEVDIHKTAFKEEELLAWSPALRCNSALLELNVMHCGLGDVGAKHIAAGLQKNHALRVLILSSNNIGATGAKELARMLQFNHTLEDLNLFKNPLGEGGGREIAGCIAFNTGLKALSVAACSIPAPEIEDIAKGVAKNGSLWNLFIWGNGLFGNHPTLLKIKEKLVQNMEAATVVKKFKGHAKGPGEESSSSSGDDDGGSSSGSSSGSSDAEEEGQSAAEDSSATGAS